MNSHVRFALDHPVFDPNTQITQGHRWRQGRISIVLTANIGLE
jgi:hypothetical protein